MKVQARVRAPTQIQEDFYPFSSPLPSPSAPPGPVRSTAPASIQASHHQRAGREAQSWEEGAGRDFLRQRIQFPAIRGKYHRNLSCSLRNLGSLGKREKTGTSGKVFSGRNTGTREACNQKSQLRKTGKQQQSSARQGENPVCRFSC